MVVGMDDRRTLHTLMMLHIPITVDQGGAYRLSPVCGGHLADFLFFKIAEMAGRRAAPLL